MPISAISPSAAAPILPRAALVREASTTSLLNSKNDVNNEISIPSGTVNLRENGNASSEGDASGTGGAGGGRKTGGGGSASGSASNDALEALIAAAKRRVQPQVGVSGADKVVGKDGSIDYRKLADLIAEQQAQIQISGLNQPTPPLAALSEPLLDLFA